MSWKLKEKKKKYYRIDKLIMSNFLFSVIMNVISVSIPHDLDTSPLSRFRRKTFRHFQRNGSKFSILSMLKILTGTKWYHENAIIIFYIASPPRAFAVFYTVFLFDNKKRSCSLNLPDNRNIRMQRARSVTFRYTSKNEHPRDFCISINSVLCVMPQTWLSSASKPPIHRILVIPRNIVILPRNKFTICWEAEVIKLTIFYESF